MKNMKRIDSRQKQLLPFKSKQNFHHLQQNIETIAPLFLNSCKPCWSQTIKKCQGKSQTRKRPSPINQSDQFPTHSRNLKLFQTLSYVQQKHQKNRKKNNEQYMNLQYELNGISRSLKNCMENGQKDIEKVLQELQQFHNKNINSYITTDAQHQAQLLNNLIIKKISPSFSTVEQNCLITRFKYTKQILQQEQLKFQQLKQRLCKQKKQYSNQTMLNLIQNSNFLFQDLENQIQDLNTISNQRLLLVQDYLQTLDFQVCSKIKSSSEGRLREDKLIEQLIQKIIYKLTYL